MFLWVTSTKSHPTLVGEGLLKLERICTDILMDMTGEIQIHQGQPFQPYQLVRKSMVNILSSLVSIMSIILIYTSKMSNQLIFARQGIIKLTHKIKLSH